MKDFKSKIKIIKIIYFLLKLNFIIIIKNELNISAKYFKNFKLNSLKLIQFILIN